MPARALSDTLFRQAWNTRNRFRIGYYGRLQPQPALTLTRWRIPQRSLMTCCGTRSTTSARVRADRPSLTEILPDNGWLHGKPPTALDRAAHGPAPWLARRRGSSALYEIPNTGLNALSGYHYFRGA